MTRPAFTEILKAIRGYSFTPGEVQELRTAIDCRVGRTAGDAYRDAFEEAVPPKSTATAESALAAVYAVIEQQAGHPDANLAGLAALVNALKPRTPLQTSGQVYVNNDAALGTLPQYNEL